MVGGTGARLGSDGVDGRDSSISNLANNPIETVEHSVEVRIRDYGVRPDSGGPGQWRGGVGVRLVFEVLAESGRVLGRGMERFRFRPWGTEGGRHGAPMRVILNEGTNRERELGRIDVLPVQAGDVLTVLMPGGGGYGDPLTRDVEAVLRDIEAGFVSIASAAAEYGVVLTPDGAVDHDATAGQRDALKTRREDNGAGADVGAARHAWESALPDNLVPDLNAALLKAPQAARQRRRRDFYAGVLPDLNGGEDAWNRSLDDPDSVRDRARSALQALLER